MNLPRFQNQWTTGNLLSLGGLAITMLAGIVGLTLGWGKLEAQANRTQELAVRQEAAIATLAAQTAMADAALRADGAAREARLRAVEMGQGRQDEKLSAILSTVSRIERQLEEKP